MYSGRYRSDMESPEPNFGRLVSGILNDVKELVTDGIALAKLEVRDELRKAKVAAVAAGVGIGVMAVGGLLLLVMLVHLLAAFTVIPLWGCYGIVGGALLLIGAVLLVTGKRTVT
jgi:putative superfamily III holin-X